MGDTSPKLLLMGRIGAAHGIKGEVRIQSFTEEPLALKTYLVTKTIESLVHAAVIEPPAGFTVPALAEGILVMVMAYLESP